MKNHAIIDPRCPEIRTDNWREQNALGWRWHGVNVKRSLVLQNEQFLSQLLYEHGKQNVTLGDPWDRTHMRPTKDPEWLGIYVRDLFNLSGKFIREFDMWWEN